MLRARVAGLARLLRTIVPLSPRGLAITLLSCAVCAAGAVRADLAALFWGSSFLLFTAYALVAGHVFRFALSRRRAASPDFVSIVLPAAGVFPGDEPEARVDARMPRAYPPGFSVKLHVPLSWHERRIDALSVRLPPGTSTRAARFEAAWRGAYASSAAVLELRDVLGFTAGRFSVPLRESLTVYPALRSPGDAARFMEQADEAAVQARRRRRSDELLEARKYYPGDDVRKLNWKVFAHLNELFLRVGEDVPPPEARILFVLDTTANPLVPRSRAADYLDSLVASCVSVMVSLMASRMEVMLSLPGVRECRSYAEPARAALLAHAADAWWTDAPWAPELPARPVHAAVFSSPGSPGLPRIMSAIRARGWGASLFIKGLEAADPPALKRTTRDLFFVPARGDEKRGPAPVGRREKAALSNAMARDLAAYAGRKVMHAAEV